METTPDFRPTLPSPYPPPGAALGTPDRALPVVPGYEVLELIGRGGMGRVYRARHLGLGRVVALKLLLHEADDNLLARFREEARAVARLQHPNIAQLYESGSADGRPYFAQEFVDCGALARALAGRPQPPRDAADLVEVVARAVHHSHTQGIIHRDLKPGNILLARKEGAGASDGPFRLADFVPKVADFGLAKTVAPRGSDTKPDSGGALTRTGEILGTPGYMPPEQASGVVANVGPPADVYALGAVLYEALTGRPPFQTPDPVQTLMLVLTRDPVPPRALQPDVPRDLETICLKCLEKQPRKRYDTARDLADDLRRYLDGRPIVARPVGALERAGKWARRNRAAAALVAVSALAALLLVAAGVALAVGYFKLKGANADLANKTGELQHTNAQLDAANRDATAQKTEAENTLALALLALDRYFFDFSDRLKDGAEPDELRLDVLRQARSTLDGLDRFRPDDPTIQNYRMAGYDRLGNAESAAGDLSGAERSYAKARDLAAKLEARFPEEPLYRRGRALATAKIANLLHARGDARGGDELLDAVAPDVRALAAARPDDPKVLELLGIVRLQEYHRELRAGRWADAEARMRELCAIYRRAAAAEPDSAARRRAVLDGDRRLAVLLLADPDPAKGAEAGRILLAGAREVDALADRTSVGARAFRAAYQTSLAGYHDARKEYARAVAAYAAALAEYEYLAAKYPNTPGYRYEQASVLYYMSVPESLGGDVRGGVARLERAETLCRELSAASPGNVPYKDLLARVSDLLNKVRPKTPPDPKP